MRVLHLDEQTGWRGGELQASWLMQGLVRRGHQVWLAGRPGSRFLEDPHGGAEITRIALPLRSELDIGSAWRLARLVREERIDIVHAHTSHMHSLACLVRMLAPGVKVVAHRRVSFPPKRDPLNRMKYRGPDRIVCVSGRVREVLLEYGLPPQQLTLVYSAVDAARLQVPPADRASLGVQPGERMLFSAGALVDQKDHATLLDAFKMVLKEQPACRLILAGEGSLRATLEAKVATLGIADHVVFLGQRSDVPAITRAADLYVSSSLSEGLGTSVLEALGSGTPVVATSAGGVGEMVINNQTGRLVPTANPAALAEAMLDALCQPEESQRMASNSKRLVEDQFGVDRMVEGNIAVYGELVG
jgi:glycosyltransferase involved in cell wall biosynthesis